MKSREKASGFREGTHTRRDTQGGSRGKVWSDYIYMCYIHICYLNTIIQQGVSMQLVHVKMVHILIKRVVRGLEA